MVKNSVLFCCLAIFQLLSLRMSATVTLPKVIGSNMVLQRNKPVAIWGSAASGERISVRFAAQVKTTTADASGNWMVHLDAMGACDKPAVMTIAGSNTITLDNILVGEVWLCSGQSNMEFTMTKSSKYANAKRSKGLDSAALQNTRNPLIRLFLVKRDLTKPGDINKGWNEAAGASLGAFSAAGYFFAKKLHDELHVPIGMIASSISGSAIEPWMSGTPVKDTLSKGANHKITINENAPGKFYSGMIRPLAPFTLKGFLWYQGETNCFLQETWEYSFKFKHLIESWRSAWKDPSTSFYFVQIAPHHYSKSKGKVAPDEETLPRFREAQAAALELPHTGMIVTTDLVDNLEDIHPTYKWEIGRRLALWALAKDYGKNVTYSGPLFRKMTIHASNVELEFEHANSGLASSDRKPLTWFSVAGTDGKFLPANAIIRDNKVIVSAPGVHAPVQVQFAWNEAAQPNLYNRDGLPAVPFRTNIPHHSTAKNRE